MSKEGEEDDYVELAFTFELDNYKTEAETAIKEALKNTEISDADVENDAKAQKEGEILEIAKGLLKDTYVLVVSGEGLKINTESTPKAATITFTLKKGEDDTAAKTITATLKYAETGTTPTE